MIYSSYYNPIFVRNIYTIKFVNFTGYVKDFDKRIACYMDGKIHNEKSPALFLYDKENLHGCKTTDKFYYLNGEILGCDKCFDDKSWERFCRLRVFK